MEQNFWLALGLTVFAGLATGIGSLIGLVAKKTNTKFLSIALGFSAGVMIYISFVDIFPKANELLINDLGESMASWMTVIGFFTGIVSIAIIDRLIPQNKNPHEIYKVEDMDKEKINKKQDLLRMGIFTALAIGIHNFPEGLATFMSALSEPSMGFAIAIAIAIHNIPEGLAVSVPIYYATGNKIKAFKYSFLSGLSEPIGALVGYLILRPFMSDIIVGFVFAAVAGIMVFISLDELLPAAKKYGKHHLSIYGLIIGMAVMALSLLLL